MMTLILVACQPDTTPTAPNISNSTPISNLGISSTNAVPTALPDALIQEADAEYLLLTNLYERTVPSVVNIEAVNEQVGFTDTGRGSGFIYDRNGHIVTNAHVVNNANLIYITFNDGFVTTAQLVAQDNYSDLAVLKVDTSVERLLPLELADSDLVKVGQRAVAIGNPWGLQGSMTAGIVSAIGRQLDSAELIDASSLPGFQNPRIIQIDATLSPGNSGGPLLNSEGRVIGVNTAIRTTSGNFEGVGFSVPSNTVRRVIPDLINHGRVDYSWLGINTIASDFGVAAFAEALNLPVQAGVLVTGITPNSPAAKAGLQGGTQIETVRDIPVCAGGDIIVAINGQFIHNMDELVNYLVIQTKPNDTIELMVVRGEQTLNIAVTLEARPSEGQLVRECE
ncbi:MAG: S1C family serine protease [Anaerolineae bacterium]|nr:S1C family serine protease [Anaerolineae bacterium]